MSDTARITFIFQKQSKRAFVSKNGKPKKLLDPILNFIQNKTADEQKDFFDALLLVDPNDRPLKEFFPRTKSWKNALAKKEIFSIPVLFHNENYCDIDYFYTIDLDEQKFSYSIGWGAEKSFSFHQTKEEILAGIKEIEKERIWRKMLEENKPEVGDREIYFEEPCGTEIRKNFAYNNRKFKELGFSFSKTGRYWYKTCEDVSEDLDALGYYELAEEYAYWNWVDQQKSRKKKVK